MSKRFGKSRVPDCTCTYSFTCGACLKAAVDKNMAERNAAPLLTSASKVKKG